jgi:heme-degrading monooxygenase HmoA
MTTHAASNRYEGRMKTKPIAGTPKPPYYAVIFTSVRTDVEEGYADMASAMDELSARQSGYLGVESAREEVGITVSYWRDLDSISAWKRAVDHMAAQRLGRERWYAHYRVRIALVERDYGFARSDAGAFKSETAGNDPPD